MRASTLRNRVRIEYPVQVKSATGAMTTTWSTFKDNVPASIETMKGINRQAAQAAWPGADVKICMRYISGLLPTMRIVFEDHIYSICGQPNDVDMRHRELEITAKTGVSSI